ncbi:MAG: type 4a pilus biogenesis protein PilO [Coriobacteriia bacterium]|nr:type 4a pilus biogenesis protein PilO [Coriobacteriia bacterium]
MRLTSQHKLYIAIAVGVVLSAALIAVLIVPQITAMGELDDQIKQADRSIQDNENLLKSRQEAKQRAAVTDIELMRLANQVPESPELPSLIIELQDIVNESGLEFVDIVPADPAAGSDENTEDDETALYWTAQFDLTVRGTWQDTVDLLQRIRRLTRQLRVEGIEVYRLEEQELDTIQALGIRIPSGNVTASSGTEQIKRPHVVVETRIAVEAYHIPSEPPPGAQVAPAPSQ